jgi:ParB family chromosome partitioning protein
MFKHISLTSITANAAQPRKLFEPKALDELAASLKENGLKQPITVRPLAYGNRFEVVMGERRFRAHQLLTERGVAGFSTIMCNVRVMDEVQRDIDAILENLQRVDIKPIEEARAFQRLLDSGLTMEDLSKKLGKQIHRIEERTRLLKLEPSILRLYETGQFSQEAAYHVSRLPDHASQMRVFKLIQKGSVNGYLAIRACVDAVLGELTQADMFGESTPKASKQDIQTINRMEAKIETMARIAANGWKDGDCVIASKVSPDRSRLMAEKLKAMQRALYAMERELRRVSAQAEAVLAA